MPTQAETKRALREAFGRGAYSIEDTSSISKEQDAYAQELAAASGNLDALENELFLETMEVMLGRLEAWLGLPTDAGLTVAQRRDRIIAHENTHGFRPADLKDSVRRLFEPKPDPDEVLIVERVLADQSVINTPENIYEFFVQVDPGNFTPQSIPAIDHVIARQQHAHCRGQFIQSLNFLTDDPASLTDRDILGA